MERALAELRRRTHPPDLELFRLYVVQKVGGDAALGRLGARLDMAMLRQTAWYREIIEQGSEQGRQAGIDEGAGAASGPSSSSGSARCRRTSRRRSTPAPATSSRR
jgi:hypothetical protein